MGLRKGRDRDSDVAYDEHAVVATGAEHDAAAYYPETNPLVALDHVAKKSNTPVSKAIVIRLENA